MNNPLNDIARMRRQAEARKADVDWQSGLLDLAEDVADDLIRKFQEAA